MISIFTFPRIDRTGATRCAKFELLPDVGRGRFALGSHVQGSAAIFESGRRNGFQRHKNHQGEASRKKESGGKIEALVKRALDRHRVSSLG